MRRYIYHTLNAGEKWSTMPNISLVGAGNDQELIQSNTTFHPGPGCLKLTTSLVNETLKFQTLISQIPNIFVEKI